MLGGLGCPQVITAAPAPPLFVPFILQPLAPLLPQITPGWGTPTSPRPFSPGPPEGKKKEIVKWGVR